MRRRLLYVLLVAAIVGGLWFNQHRGIKSIATETHSALCSLRLDVEVRQRNAKRYLADVKAGRRKPIAGITTTDIRRSIDNQQSTLDALESLRCA